MQYAPYSASRLNVYEQCARKFKYKYVDKVYVHFEPSLPLTRGKILHSLLEFHGKLTLKESLGKLKADKDIASSPFFTADVIKECVKIYQSFIQTDMAKDIYSDLALGIELHLGLDYKLEPCEYFGDDVLFRGMIDRVVVNQKSNVVRIIDWKSGKDKSGENDTPKQAPDQLMHYGSWYFSKFPVDELKIMYVFVEHNTKLEYTLTRAKVSAYKKALLKPIINAERDTTFEKNPTALCDYCEFRVMCDADKG